MMTTVVRFDPTAYPQTNAADVSLDTCRVYLWEHTLSPEQISEMATRLDVELPNQKHRKRFIEQASTRIMLACTMGKACRLMHTGEGLPYIASEHDLCISITHTDGVYALSVARSRHGIDIERITPRANRLRSRFLRSDEQQLLLPPPLDAADTEATALWCAKEAAFKAFSTPSLTLLEQVRLQLTDEGPLAAVPADLSSAEKKIELTQLGNLMLAVCC